MWRVMCLLCTCVCDLSGVVWHVTCLWFCVCLCCCVVCNSVFCVCVCDLPGVV